MNESVQFDDIKVNHFDDTELMTMTYNDIFERIIKLMTLCNVDGSYILPAGAGYFTDKNHTVLVTYKDLELFKKNLRRTKTMIKYQFKDNSELYKFLNLKNFRIFSLFHKENLNWIDTSNITDMRELFSNTNYNADISMWDVSNVQDMTAMFVGSMINSDISKWDVHNVRKMNGMFAFSAINCDLSKWDVSNVIDVESWRELMSETESCFYMKYNGKYPLFKRDLIEMNMLKEDFNFNDIKTDDNKNDMFIQQALMSYFKGARSWTKTDDKTGEPGITVKNGNVYFNKDVTFDVYYTFVDDDGNVTGSHIGFWNYLLTNFDHNQLHFKSCILKTIPDNLKKLHIPPFITKIKLTSGEYGQTKELQLRELIFDDDSQCTNVYHSFMNCPKLEYLKLPKLMVKIDEAAFYNCQNLKTVILPQCLRFIDKDAFGNCKRLEHVENFTTNVNLGRNHTVFHQDVIKKALVSAFNK